MQEDRFTQVNAWQFREWLDDTSDIVREPQNMTTNRQYLNPSILAQQVFPVAAAGIFELTSFDKKRRDLQQLLEDLENHPFKAFWNANPCEERPHVLATFQKGTANCKTRQRKPCRYCGRRTAYYCDSCFEVYADVMQSRRVFPKVALCSPVHPGPSGPRGLTCYQLHSGEEGDQEVWLALEEKLEDQLLAGEEALEDLLAIEAERDIKQFQIGRHH